jgi:hypothetical protein
VPGGTSWHCELIVSIAAETTNEGPHTPSAKIEIEPAQVLPVGGAHSQAEHVRVSMKSL